MNGEVWQRIFDGLEEKNGRTPTMAEMEEGIQDYLSGQIDQAEYAVECQDVDPVSSRMFTLKRALDSLVKIAKGD